MARDRIPAGGRRGNEQMGRTCLPLAALMAAGVVLAILSSGWAVIA